MSIQSSWEYSTRKKTTATNADANTIIRTDDNEAVKENKADKTLVGITMKKLPVTEASLCLLHVAKGMVSEFIYNERQSVINHVLLPLLRQSGKEDRWLLWVTPNKRLCRQWLASSGLPLNKVIQLNQIRPIDSINAMEKALASGNYSVVLGWLPELSQHEINKLHQAAQKGTSLGFIMRPQNLVHQFMPESNRLQIYSNYYH
ncbi:phosphatidate cytidylyltransferase [Xenorhabdus mauleonii]|uniref:Cell division inhibitor SulA n=1 Tax=Xenorhabdus mauleonii TaxID=351675 RepID=A0A1I3HYZ6_9GAMM|nr:SOS-induced cell division inhibitor SulA [Xenorhabdus mauleonii]PHM40221.1 phosphatidate cytidylyltransferase [Xenorhabdus mauleonii]SFI40809.1 cell division inhibitor SulA [Xenorhabdus mauleonii]